MAVLFLCGFDAYGPANTNVSAVQAIVQTEWTSASATGITIAAPLSITGQSLNLTGSGGSASKTLAANYTRLIGGIRFASTLGARATLMQFIDTATPQCTITVETTGAIILHNGTESGTTLATGGAVLSNSTHYVEWDITFGNSASYQVWLDGASLFSGTGDTTGTANAYANRITIATNGGTANCSYDDLYLFDSTGSTSNAVLLSTPRIETSFPMADSAIQFAVGAGILGTSVSRNSSTNAPAAGSLALRRFTPAVAATLNSIGIMPGATSAGAHYRGVCYADSGGTAPGTLMSSGTEVTGVTSGTAASLPLNTPQSLSAGTQYWIGFINDTSVVLQQSDANTLGYRAANTYASGAPGTAPAMTSGQQSWLLWGNLSGISSANYSTVDEQPPPGVYSYVFDSTTGHEDLYTMNSLSATPATIHTVGVKAFAARSDTGARTMSVHLKSGATDAAGSSFTPGTTFGWTGAYWDTNPSGSVAWTPTALNAATAGLKVDT